MSISGSTNSCITNAALYWLLKRMGMSAMIPAYSSYLQQTLLIILGLFASDFAKAQITQKSADQISTFTLKGVINNAQVPYLYLQYTNSDNLRIIDSCKIENGKFQFKGSVSEPTWAVIKANSKSLPDETNLNISPIYLENGVLTASLTYNEFKNIRITGSQTQNEKISYDALMAPYIEEYSRIRQNLRKTDYNQLSKLQKDSIDKLVNQAVKSIQSSTYRFVSSNPNSYISAHELKTYNNRWPTDTMRALYVNLSANVKKSRDGQEIAETLAATDSAAVGSTAYDFEGIDLNGKIIKLSDLKGKFVLLDFWGSWCVPCREGNPHLIELFKNYKERNLEIIGISCFDKEIQWKNAIQRDGIDIWNNIIDVDGKPEKPMTIAHRYAVFSFPTKILIDKSGTIVGRFSGNQSHLVDAKLAQVLE